jgi:YD repeat-containing protein
MGPFDHCYKCSAKLTPGKEQCPACGASVPLAQFTESSRRRSLLWRNLRRALIAVLLIAVVHLYRPYINHYVRLLWPLRFSPLVTAAVERANGQSSAVAAIGSMKAGWSVKGYVRNDGTGWSEGRLWIPVQGTKGEGTLYVRAGRESGPWVFSDLELTVTKGGVVRLLGVQPSLGANLKPYGHLYLIPIGQIKSLNLQELISYYNDALGLKIELLAAIPFEERVRDQQRRQLIAEELINLMRRRLPKLANDPSAILLGITEEDMYIRSYGWSFAVNLRRQSRFGVVSSYRLQPVLSGIAHNQELLTTRVRKLVSKNVGVLVYRLPLNDDPTSLLYSGGLGGRDFDKMIESFDGLGPQPIADEFTTGHAQSPAKIELLPNLTEIKADGHYPCLHAKRIESKGSAAVRFSVALDNCLQRSLLDTVVDEIEIDLRYGLVITRTTDLFIPDSVPVALTRCYRLWDEDSRTFGRGSALSWDMYPIGSRNPYTYVEIITCDGSRLRFERISQGTGYADALFEHRQTATPFFGSRFSWNGNGWDLKRSDGSLLLFPESYYAKRGVDGALIGFRDGTGQQVKIERDRRRNVKKITSPGGGFVSFDYDSAERVTKAVDNRNRTVKYSYDAGGRLFKVENGKSFRSFDYNDMYLMSIEENGHKFAAFRYKRGRLGQITFADGQIYKFDYDYDPKDNYTVVRTYMQEPNGTVTKFDIKPE